MVLRAIASMKWMSQRDLIQAQGSRASHGER